MFSHRSERVLHINAKSITFRFQKWHGVEESGQEVTKFIALVKQYTNKRQNDCLLKQRTHYRLENGSLGFIETLHKQ